MKKSSWAFLSIAAWVCITIVCAILIWIGDPSWTGWLSSIIMATSFATVIPTAIYAIVRWLLGYLIYVNNKLKAKLEIYLVTKGLGEEKATVNEFVQHYIKTLYVYGPCIALGIIYLIWQGLSKEAVYLICSFVKLFIHYISTRNAAIAIWAILTVAAALFLKQSIKKWAKEDKFKPNKWFVLAVLAIIVEMIATGIIFRYQFMDWAYVTGWHIAILLLVLLIFLRFNKTKESLVKTNTSSEPDSNPVEPEPNSGSGTGSGASSGAGSETGSNGPGQVPGPSDPSQL